MGRVLHREIYVEVGLLGILNAGLQELLVHWKLEHLAIFAARWDGNPTYIGRIVTSHSDKKNRPA